MAQVATVPRHNLAATHSALVEKMAAMLGSYKPYVDVGSTQPPRHGLN